MQIMPWMCLKPQTTNPNIAMRLLTACAGGAAPRAPPVPAASSDRVAERALCCLLALLRGTYAAPPWDAPPPEPGDAAGQGAHGHAAESGHGDGVAAALVPAPGVLVDLLQRLAALAEVGRERSAEEVQHGSVRCLEALLVAAGRAPGAGGLRDEANAPLLAFLTALFLKVRALKPSLARSSVDGLAHTR